MTGSGSDQSDTCYDVVVVGGAMVGGTLAYALAHCGYRVALLDAKSLNRSADSAVNDQAQSDQAQSDQAQTASKNLRTTAVAPVASTILDAFGIWSGIQEGATPITTIQVSQQGSFGVTRLDCAELGVAALGHVVANDSYTGHLYRLLHDVQNLTIDAPVVVTGINSDSKFVKLNVSGVQDCNQGCRSYTARLVIAADGGCSVVRAMSGIGVSETDYGQSAVVATVNTEQPNNGTAFERFTHTGPLALLPVSAHRSSLVFTTDAANRENLLRMSDSDFLAQVQQRFGHRLGLFLGCSSRAAFPIVLRESTTQHEGRVLLLGNAARTLHPVAGQGFNLAVRDIGKLVELLIDLKQGSENPQPDPGSSELLKRFVEERAQDQSRTIWLTDGLAKTFRGSSGWFSHLRAMGLVGLDTFPLVRIPFTKAAMGHQAPLPDLPYS